MFIIIYSMWESFKSKKIEELAGGYSYFVPVPVQDEQYINYRNLK
jgi:hypothetical protein